MKNIVVALVGALLSSIVLVGGASAPAGAAPRDPYVTRAEFAQVRKGMPISKVHRIFDVSGKQISYTSGCCGGLLLAQQGREYRTKGRYGFVHVYFERKNGVWRLSDKYALFI